MKSWLRLVISIGLLAGLLSTASPADAYTLEGTIDDNDVFHPTTLARGGPASTCSAANFPGLVSTAGLRGESWPVGGQGFTECLTVTVTTVAPGSIFVAAYGSYNTLVPGEGFMGSTGTCVGAGGSFTFTTPANGNHTIVVEECAAAQVSTPYALQVSGPSTAVSFRSLSASPARSGVLVRWTTASESQMLGFHVYRQVNGKRVRLTPKVIVAKGRGGYSFLDRKAPKGKAVRYWVQVVNLDGTRSWYGPALVLRLGHRSG